MRIDLTKCAAQENAWHAIRPGARVCLPWGRGIGKSQFTRWVWYLLAMQHPGIRIVLLMPTLEQARRVHADLILAELSGEWKFLGATVNRTTWRISFQNGAWVQIVTAMNAQTSARGIRCDVVCVDEADDIDESLIHAVVKPWFSEPRSMRILVIGGTPRRGRKGLLWAAHKDWPALYTIEADPAVAKRLRRYKSFHATAYDAPEIVDPDYLEDIRRDTPEDIFKREWLCDFDSAEGLVYAEFSERFHVREPPPGTQFTATLVGGDHGHVDPSVLVVIQMEGWGRDVRLWVTEEYYETDKPATWWAELAKRLIVRFPHAYWYCDTAGTGITSSSLYAALGAKVQHVDKSGGSLERGIGYVKRWLQIHSRIASARDVPRGHVAPPTEEYASLYVHPRCKRTIDEFGMYRHRRDPRNAEHVLEEILPGNDHALDSIRYVIANHFPDAPVVQRGLANLLPR
jgi:hypothetical protein